MPGRIELYLIRHGAAEDRGSAWPDDARRPLTDKGIEELRKVARGLVRLSVTFDVVLTSPFVRATQTAEALAHVLHAGVPVEPAAGLAPGGSYAAVLADLAARSHHRRIALIGHEPDIGRLAARLCGARRPFRFKKATVCRIDVRSIPPAGSGTLRWLLPPAVLRAVRDRKG